LSNLIVKSGSMLRSSVTMRLTSSEPEREWGARADCLGRTRRSSVTENPTEVALAERNHPIETFLFDDHTKRSAYAFGTIQFSLRCSF